MRHHVQERYFVQPGEGGQATDERLSLFHLSLPLSEEGAM
jgi:hypothetical protein